LVSETFIAVFFVLGKINKPAFAHIEYRHSFSKFNCHNNLKHYDFHIIEFK